MKIKNILLIMLVAAIPNSVFSTERKEEAEVLDEAVIAKVVKAIVKNDIITVSKFLDENENNIYGRGDHGYPLFDEAFCNNKIKIGEIFVLRGLNFNKFPLSESINHYLVATISKLIIYNEFDEERLLNG